jgi:chromosome segregation ATPase
MSQSLDTALKERLLVVLDGGPATEAELRRLFEEGQACALIMSAQLERREQRLSDLSADPTSPIAELASTMREVNELRPELDQLQALLEQLEARAREFRTSWLTQRR